MKFNTMYKVLRDKPETNDGESETEKFGNLTAKEKIKRLMVAGKRLSEAAQYDFTDEADEKNARVDPTRHPSYDRDQAFQDGLKVTQSLKEQAGRSKNIGQGKSGTEDQRSVQSDPLADQTEGQGI